MSADYIDIFGNDEILGGTFLGDEEEIDLFEDEESIDDVEENNLGGIELEETEYEYEYVDGLEENISEDEEIVEEYEYEYEYVDEDGNKIDISEIDGSEEIEIVSDGIEENNLGGIEIENESGRLEEYEYEYEDDSEENIPEDEESNSAIGGTNSEEENSNLETENHNLETENNDLEIENKDIEKDKSNISAMEEEVLKPDTSLGFVEVKDNEERVSNALNLNKGNFVLKYGEIEFSDLSATEPIKKGRKETYLGLTTSIKELGILTPIHVMVTEGYAEWLDGGREEDFKGFKYIIVDGFRRVYGGLKNGLKGCMAVIWEFEDKDLGSQLLTSLSRLLNKVQTHSWSEVWYLYQVLELHTSMSPGTLEYLLSLESGDAMKLKDIMLCDYDDVKGELLSNKKTLSQCYNILQKYRKEEDKLMMDDTRGISEVDNAEEIVDKEDKASLSDNEVMELLDMIDDYSGELSEEDFDELAGNDIENERQKVGERHPLDPALRAAVLARDEYCCQVSGLGKGLPAEIALSILNVHHIIPVHANGEDTMENLITVSLDVHTLIHIIERRNGKLGMKKEDFDKLPEEQQDYLKKVMRIARVAVEANRRKGTSLETIKRETSNTMRFKMPGVVQKENLDAVNSNGGVYNYRERTKAEEE